MVYTLNGIKLANLVNVEVISQIVFKLLICSDAHSETFQYVRHFCCINFFHLIVDFRFFNYDAVSKNSTIFLPNAYTVFTID